jgi:hypothetical protein
LVTTNNELEPRDRLHHLIFTMNNTAVAGRKTIHELFIEAGQIDRLFTGTTPTDLFRFSETNGPLSDKMLMYPVLKEYMLANGRPRTPDIDRIELPAGSGQHYIFPRLKTGLSLFDGPGDLGKPGSYHVVPMGSTIPPGLAISRDNLSKRVGYTHYSIHVVHVMHEMHYLFLLRRFAVTALPLNHWKTFYPERAQALKI